MRSASGKGKVVHKHTQAQQNAGIEYEVQMVCQVKAHDGSLVSPEWFCI